MTLYRLIDLTSLDDGIREKYRNPMDKDYDYHRQSVSLAGSDAVLYWGTVARAKAGWASTVSQITGLDLPVGNTTASAVLLIPDRAYEAPQTPDGTDEHRQPSETSEKPAPFSAWALTFGMGFQMIDQGHIDVGFGQRIAIRSATSSGLNAISKTTLDERPQMVRSTIPSGGTLRRFGFDELGDLATRLVAEGHIEGIGDPLKPVKVRGADSLNLPLLKTPRKLLDNLEQIKTVLDKEPATAELAALEHLSLVKDAQTKKQLDQRLIEAIGSNSEQVALSYPYEIIDEFGQVGAFKLCGIYQRGVKDCLPTTRDLLDPVRAVPEEERLDKLGHLGVLLYKHSDDSDPCSPKIPVKKWLTFQVTINGRRYFLQNNRWYVMDRQYVETVQRQVASIFARGPYFDDLPEWPIYQIPDDDKEQKKRNAELQYNKRIAEHLGGLCLDQKLIYPEGSSSGIEACDILLKDGVFVHVKHVSASAPASHLLAQALVATDLLRTDQRAQEKLSDRIREAGGDPDQYEKKPRRVVIIMAKDDEPLTAESLFTFTMINLVRHDRNLGSGMGVELNIAPVVRKKLPTN